MDTGNDDDEVNTEAGDEGEICGATGEFIVLRGECDEHADQRLQVDGEANLGSQLRIVRMYSYPRNIPICGIEEATEFVRRSS